MNDIDTSSLYSPELPEGKVDCWDCLHSYVVRENNEPTVKCDLDKVTSDCKECDRYE